MEDEDGHQPVPHEGQDQQSHRLFLPAELGGGRPAHRQGHEHREEDAVGQVVDAGAQPEGEAGPLEVIGLPGREAAGEDRRRHRHGRQQPPGMPPPPVHLAEAHREEEGRRHGAQVEDAGHPRVPGPEGRLADSVPPDLQQGDEVVVEVLLEGAQAEEHPAAETQPVAEAPAVGEEDDGEKAPEEQRGAQMHRDQHGIHSYTE